MKTLTIQIGNTDNKLTQQEWSAFVMAMRDLVSLHGRNCHFFGGSPNWEMWQNVAFILEINSANLEALKAKAQNLRRVYKQDSVAWTEGETKFY